MSSKKVYTCDVTECRMKKFSSKYRLQEHKRNMQGDQITTSCSQCKKHFSTRFLDNTVA